MRVVSNFFNYITLLFIVTILALLSACSNTPNYASMRDGPPLGNVDVSKIPNAVPKNEPRSPYGNPVVYSAHGVHYHVMASAKGYNKKGVASWYGRKFQGRLTSSHERYDPWAMTAASPTLPIPSYVQVTNLKNGQKVIVKVNDRGPFASNRIIDLSYAAAKKLGYAGIGTAPVRVTAIDTSRSSGVQFASAKSTSVSSNNTHTRTTMKLASLHNPSPISSTPSKKIYIQVAAYSKYASANQVKSKLKVLTTRPIRVTAANTSSGHMKHSVYRVQIGPLKNIAESDSISHKLHQHGYNHIYAINA